MKNSADLGGCYPPRPKTEVDNTLHDLQNSSFPFQPHSIVANYMRQHKHGKSTQLLNLKKTSILSYTFFYITVE